MKQPGFMIYAEDWAAYTEDFNDEELGRMLRALLAYFDTQEQPSFSDRGMRQFFRLASRGIDLDIKRYNERCRQNAYNRYKGACKQQHEKPMSYEEWLTNVDDRGPSSTNVDDREPSSTNVTNTNTNTNTSSQPSTINHQPSKTKNKKSTPVSSTNASRASDFGAPLYKPPAENEFERMREQALSALWAAH